ncbi:hypothetical protein Cgig2_024934 [Carnegiea gigantea]|uniref:Uncharacterized protein n=1 Tax=Carnegiea gigantea TaxID=171969 RepID=A0A9Q1KDZ4_9CARY|nr:hypothetical protein Cgig2_024934 [Carnegiea gigantea]
MSVYIADHISATTTPLRHASNLYIVSPPPCPSDFDGSDLYPVSESVSDRVDMASHGNICTKFCLVFTPVFLQGPTKVIGIKKAVKYISAGYSHSCAITVDGELYMWGKNSNGQLGLGKSAPKVVAKPFKVAYLTGMSIDKAALGSEHSIAVTDEGVTLSWGTGSSGRLGHDRRSGLLGFLSSSSEYTPRLIKRLEGIKVRGVAAGLLHSACIDGIFMACLMGVLVAVIYSCE